jgi:glycosyltransferase involved in cell wall biosynthesis
MSKRSICFITNELYPLGPGGIGRMMFNFAKQNAADGFPAELHFLVPPDLVPDDAARRRLDSTFEGLAEVHVCTPLHEIPDHTAHLMDRASFLDWSLDLMWSTSYRYMRALMVLEQQRGIPFDIIEFPDFGGWALATVEAKRAGLAFQDSILSARLHSTQGVIARAERFFDPSYWNGLLMDAEAHLLRHADLIVGHEQFVIDHNRDHYGLADRWQGRTVLEFPAIVLDDDIESAAEDTAKALGTGRGEDTDFIFSSRLQRFKRPDIFLRAAIAFAEKHPDHKGRFRLVSYGWDKPYIEWMEGLIPDALQDRVQFVYKASPQQRAEWLRQSVVVIPSDYESLCLFAYEASQMGASVILNRDCGVFGQGSRWNEGDNCLMFDGSVEDLVVAMEQALDWVPSEKVSITPDRPYWETAQDVPAVADIAPVSLSLVGFGYTTRFELEQHFSMLAMLAATPALPGQKISFVLMVPSAIYDASSEVIARASAQGWSVQRTSGVEECPETLRKRFAALDSEAVLLIGPGYGPRADFILHAAQALGRDPDLALAGGFLEEIDRDTGMSQTMRIFGGEMPSQALLSSRIAPLCSLFRTSLFERRSFDPRACAQWFEVFIRDCAIDGEKMVILPVVAATLEGEALYRIETSKKLSAGVYDPAGMKAGLAPRLIGLEPYLPGREMRGKAETLPQNVLQAGRMIAPMHVARPFPPVLFLEAHKGLMVHPLQGTFATMAEIAGPVGRIARFSVETVIVDDDNSTCAEVALACVPADASPEDIEAIMHSRDSLLKGYAASGWHLLDPGPGVTVSLGLRGASKGRDRIILMSRLSPGGREVNARVLFRNCTVEYDSHIF